MFPIQVFRLTLQTLTDIFCSHRVRFHLTGGIANVAYGEPRMTQDIDVVVNPAQHGVNLDIILESFASPGFIFEEVSVRSAVSDAGTFQLLDKQEALNWISTRPS